MRIHRTAPTRNFSTFANALIRDLAISWCAAAVLMYLLSLPNGAHASIRSLALLRKEGRTRIAEALRELEESRYLRRLTVKDPESGRITTEYEVFDAPYDQLDAPEGEFVNKAGTIPAPGDVVDGDAGQQPSVVKTLVKEPPSLPPPDPTPEVEDPESLGSAARLLFSLRETDARLSLGMAEALRLAPLVEEWRAVGASDATVRAALTGGLPSPVHSAASFLESRLRRKKPAPAPRPTPAPTPAARPECEDCRAPIPAPGRCRDCRSGGEPVRIAEVEGFIAAARRGASAARAALSAA